MISTRNRVPAHSTPGVNRSIQEEIEASRVLHQRNPGHIPKRLKELDEEWDIERAIQANAGAIGFAGLLLSFTDRRWIILPMAVTGFLFQHALQGWCPPVPILRRLGFRTSYEIEQERRGCYPLTTKADLLPLNGCASRTRPSLTAEDYDSKHEDGQGDQQDRDGRDSGIDVIPEPHPD
jgi:hypothetical protein